MLSSISYLSFFSLSFTLDSFNHFKSTDDFFRNLSFPSHSVSFISDSGVFISRISLGSVLYRPDLYLTCSIFLLSSWTWTMVTIPVLTPLSVSFLVSLDWSIDFSPHYGCIFLLLWRPGNLFDARHCEFYFIEWWMNLYFYKYFWALFQDLLKSPGNSVILSDFASKLY